MKLRTVKNLNITNKAVLLRVDYNVSLIGEGDSRKIVDDTRIRLSLPTIEYILKQKPKRLVICSHLGRPKGRVNPELSLDIVAEYLESILGKKIYFEQDYRHISGRRRVNSLTKGEIIMLENVRFHKEEKLNSRSFASQLAQLGEVFVNDAFGAAHRAHASVVEVAEYLPSVAGLLLAKEIEVIGGAMNNPKHPFVAIIGGAKATTKIPMIEKLMTIADDLLLGGGVANTFLHAMGYLVGRSLYDPESERIAQNLIWKATRVNTNLWIPSDLVIGSFATGHRVGVVNKEDMPRQWMALDIGPTTQKDFSQVIATAKTIIWNGPMGANEIPAFNAGTEAIYNAVTKNKTAISIVGGGDTLVSIKGHDHSQNITHISTGGGAMLEYIEKGTLPGLEVLG